MKSYIPVACLALGVASLGSAATIPNFCIGYCGVAGPNGVVTVSPNGGNYSFVSTFFGVAGGGILPSGALGDETNGSTLTSAIFTAGAGDVLDFNFHYVTSDGDEFTDYAWAALINAGDNSLNALLFTARTTPVGSIFPGFGMPANSATLTPAAGGIIAGTTWDQLGGSSGACWDVGCGHSGWVNSQYAVAAGNYYVAFGVTNWLDDRYASGLAIDGLPIRVNFTYQLETGVTNVR